jgi:hypothetical protein
MIESQFQIFTEQIKNLKIRPEIELDFLPPPARLAPLAFAISADIPDLSAPDPEVDDELASGRFVLLANPQYQESWQGFFRAVTFVRAPIDREMADDPMLNDVGWSWLKEALAIQAAASLATSGTVTRVASSSYGTISSHPERSEIEIRGSWTPEDGNFLMDHAQAWISLLEMVAGISPLPEGVTALSLRRK